MVGVSDHAFIIHWYIWNYSAPLIWIRRSFVSSVSNSWLLAGTISVKTVKVKENSSPSWVFPWLNLLFQFWKSPYDTLSVHASSYIYVWLMDLHILPQAIPSLLASDAGSEVSTAAIMCYLDYNRAKNMLALNPFTTRDTILSPQSSQTLKQSLPGGTLWHCIKYLCWEMVSYNYGLPNRHRG